MAAELKNGYVRILPGPGLSGGTGVEAARTTRLAVARPLMAGRTLENLTFPELELNFDWDRTGPEPIRIVRFVGKVSNSNSYELNRKIHVLTDGAQATILDLSRLEYINSSGVAILFSLFFRSRQEGQRLVIGGVHPFLRRVFSLMDLPDELLVLDTVEEARATF